MGISLSKVAQSATGWTNSLNATSTSIDVATSACTALGAGLFSPSPSLVLGLFDLSAAGVATITSLAIRVSASSAAGGAVMSVYLARNGVRRGAVKTQALTTTLTEHALGVDLWDAVLTDADCANLQVVCFVTANDTALHSISYVTARAVFPDGDAVPAAFSFAPASLVDPSTLVTSAVATVSATTIASCISIVNGEYEKNGNGVWLTADGSVVSTNTVRVRHTTAPTSVTAKTTALTIGGVSANFVSTTNTLDVTPNAFAFSSSGITGQSPNIVIQSGSATISGIAGPSPISVVNGSYRVNYGAWTTVAGFVNNGDLIFAQMTTALTYSTLKTTTVTVGGVSAGFLVTTRAQDGLPNVPVFATLFSVATSTLTTSAAVVISGPSDGYTVVVSGGTYSINGAAFTSAAGVFYNGNSIRLQHTSAATTNTYATTTLTFAGVLNVAFHSVTGVPDDTPDAFSFASVSNARLSEVVLSALVTIAGISVTVPVTTTGDAEVSIAGGGYVLSGSIASGQTLRVRITASARPGATKTTTVTVGTGSASFTVVTQFAMPPIDF